MTLGDKVHCKGYLTKTKNFFSTPNISGHTECFLFEDGKTKGIEEDTYTDLYQIKQAEFDGIYVGKKEIGTRLNAVYEESDVFTGWRFFKDKPETMAIIYYRNNRHRLVPIDMITGYVG